MSWQRTTKSDNYHICRNKVNAADIWRERAHTLCAEISQTVSLAVVTTYCEKSAEAIVVKKFL